MKTSYRVFSRNEAGYGLECPQCGRVLKVAKASVSPIAGGLLLNPPVLCPCGFSGAGAEERASEKVATYEIPGITTKKAPSFSESISALFYFAILGGLLLLLGTCVYHQVVPESPAEVAARKAENNQILSANSKWNGSVFWVETYLKKNLKDPDSYQSIEWSSVRDLGDGTKQVRHKYRAKNSFGGYEVANQRFTFTEAGSVLSVVDIP